jgi:hypothetical protein
MNRKSSFIPLIYLAITMFVLLWLNKFLKSLQGFFGKENSDVTKKNQDKELELAKDEIKYDYLSHPKSQYFVYADAIEVALQASWTEDEQAVYNVLKKLWNNSDFLMLKLAWNKRPIGFYGFRTPMTLEQAIRFYFSQNQINTCNHILKTQKGGFITYKI